MNIDIDVARGEMVVSTTLRTYEEFSRFCTAMNAARDVLWDRESDPEPEVAPKVPASRKKRKVRLPTPDSKSGKMLEMLRRGVAHDQVASTMGHKDTLSVERWSGKFKKRGWLK